ncbi:hypothetical protein HDA32_001791 [Spinactinospora alkalitolerans]|uniref:SseB protein N-terminal domain-containing protein n=1 Tax=Spinactinospora alkalitolerans TaxID=687207 RepID=A0A852TSR4_9ACTN|nr:SseB family protein [Spinactinospora alkalitolerans]NYE46671.1 hypothetical protein [Spinactinospora alkalitolerans]
MSTPTPGDPASENQVPGAPDSGGTADFPVNPVEEALGQAIERSRRDGAADGPEEEGDTAPVMHFIETLREGSLWVPLPEGSGMQDDGSVALPTLELEGSSFIPVFTSEEQLRVHSEGLPFTVLPARDLAGVLPQGVGLALNPGNPVSAPIYPESVPALAQE